MLHGNDDGGSGSGGGEEDTEDHRKWGRYVRAMVDGGNGKGMGELREGGEDKEIGRWWGMNVDGNVACSCARCVRKGMVWSAGRAIGISVRATPPTAHILWGPPKDQALLGLPSHSMLVDNYPNL